MTGNFSAPEPHALRPVPLLLGSRVVCILKVGRRELVINSGDAHAGCRICRGDTNRPGSANHGARLLHHHQRLRCAVGLPVSPVPPGGVIYMLDGASQ